MIEDIKKIPKHFLPDQHNEGEVQGACAAAVSEDDMETTGTVEN